MIVEANQTHNQVTIRGDHGTEITLSWAAAANLSTLLREKSHEAEPAALPGRSYCPSVERDRR
jgi:hypothetical protein